MPRSIKPKMSRDELSGFDWLILGISYEEDIALVEIRTLDGPLNVEFSEKDLEQMIQFIRRNNAA